MKANIAIKPYLLTALVAAFCCLTFLCGCDEKKSCKPKIKVLEPNKATIWELGKKYKIRWESKCSGGDVRIRLRDKKEYLDTIAESTEDDGVFELEAPNWLTTGTVYRIRINFAEDPDVYDNGQTFRITHEIGARPKVKVTKPDQKSVWEIGKSYDIKWNINDPVGNLRIRLRRKGKTVDTVFTNLKELGEKRTFKYQVPHFVRPDDSYRIVVNYTEIPEISSKSPKFPIIQPAKTND